MYIQINAAVNPVMFSQSIMMNWHQKIDSCITHLTFEWNMVLHTMSTYLPLYNLASFQLSLLLFHFARKGKEMAITTELSNAAMAIDGNK